MAAAYMMLLGRRRAAITCPSAGDVNHVRRLRHPTVGTTSDPAYPRRDRHKDSLSGPVHLQPAFASSATASAISRFPEARPRVLFAPDLSGTGDDAVHSLPGSLQSSLRFPMPKSTPLELISSTDTEYSRASDKTHLLQRQARLVTGGAGLIGSHIVDLLVEAGLRRDRCPRQHGSRAGARIVRRARACGKVRPGRRRHSVTGASERGYATASIRSFTRPRCGSRIAP